MAEDVLVVRKGFRTVDRKVTGFPFDPQAYGQIIKPGELIDIVEVTPLSLAEARTYNLLIANAWDQITEPVVHRIKKADLKGGHESNDRLMSAIETLMGAIAIIHHTVDGKPRKTRVQLLGTNSEETDEKGYLYYVFPPELRRIIANSSVFARLKTQIMYQFRCKYALKLYEMVKKRAGLDYKQCEEFRVEDFRGLLGVPAKKLRRFADLHRYVLKPALREVNGLTGHRVEIGLIRRGKRVDKLLLTWLEKNPEGKREAARELERHSAGRAARLRGKVEPVVWDD